MQTPIATVCLSGSLSDNVRSAAEADSDQVELFANEIPSFDREGEELLAWIAATVGWRPRAQRF